MPEQEYPSNGMVIDVGGKQIALSGENLDEIERNGWLDLSEEELVQKIKTMGIITSLESNPKQV